jgi:hypothetical protein
MARIALRRGRPLALLFAGALLGASVGVATGAIPTTGTGVFYACYDGGGTLKVIDFAKTQTCPKGHTGPVSWSQIGPQGIQGIQGIQGPQGEAGPAGTVATSEVYYVQDDGGSLGGTSGGHQVSMTLPAGSYVIEVRGRFQNSAFVSDGAPSVCRMPAGHSVFIFLEDRNTNWHDTQEDFEATVAINHAGGALEVLDCFSTSDDTSVSDITILATPVGSVLAG